MLCQHVYDCCSSDLVLLSFARMVRYAGFVRRRVEKLYSKEMTMSDGNKINLGQIHNGFIDGLENYKNQDLLDSLSLQIKSSDDVFPWFINFNKMMSSSVGSRNSQVLEHLLSLYIQNIITSINIYCGKALDMIKSHISSTLTFFHLYWNDIKEFVGDCDSYLNSMSTLLGIYIDMELKTFRNTKDSTSIVAKLFSALWIYLNHSEKHIFRVLFKLKHSTKKSMKIYEPIIMKSFKRLKRNVKETWTDIEYVRYLLMLKMWKRTKENLEEIKEANKIALTILGPHLPKMRDELLKIIPKPPIEHKNETLWLLQPNVFDLKTACSNFLAFEDLVSIQLENSYLMKNSDFNNFQKSQIISSCDINAIQECNMNFELNKSETNKYFQNAIDCSKSVDQTSSIKRRNKFKKVKKPSKLKSGEIILIDLTEENESLEIDKDKKQKKKCKRKLEWLKMMKKKCNVQKSNAEVKYRNEVEIADAHSTKNSENSIVRNHLEYLPISDNTVSESTESYVLEKQELFQDNTHMSSQCVNDYIHNKRNKELKCTFQHNQCDVCTLLLKQNDIQHNRILSLLKFLNAVGQNIKEPKAILNLFRESREQNKMSFQHTVLCNSITNESTEINIQEETFSQPNSSIQSKECQDRIINTQCIKQELPTNTDCNVAITDNIYCQNESVRIQNDCHSHDFRSSSACSQISEIVKQKPCDTHECMCTVKKANVKPFVCHNYNIVNTKKSEDTLQTIVNDNITDKKSSICDKNIICMLSDLDKCMDVLNRISEHIMTVHAEKQRLECLDKADVCAVSTTITRDQSAKSSLGSSQNTSLMNSEKLNKLLELYERKEFLNVSNCKDSHRRDNQETNTLLSELKCESDSCKNCMVPTPQSKDTPCREKNHGTCTGNKLSDGFVCSHVKSEFEQLVKEEDIEMFETIMDQSEKVNEHKPSVVLNNETHVSEYFPHDLKMTESLNKNVHCESMLQSPLQKDNITKQSAEEFENIDILDSILNGDITMEDEQEILEESQSSLMSPISYDNSNNVLNCITEFFLQTEDTYSNDKEDKYSMSDLKYPVTPLPEGSLGTTGILNSLLDFELTNMNSLPNDSMYSNVQAVNPRLIKKSFENENLSKSINTSELNSHSPEMITADKSNEVNMLPQKKSISSFPDQSIGSIISNNISSDLKESFPIHSLSGPADNLNIDTVIEKCYIYQKEDVHLNHHQVQPLNNTLNTVSCEMCVSNDIPVNTLINCESQQDEFSSLHKHVCVELGSNSFSIKEPSECISLSSTDLIAPNDVINSQCEGVKYENFLEKKNMQENVQHSCKEKQNHLLQHKIEVTAQSRSSTRKLKYKKRMKKEKKEEIEELALSVAQPNQDELSIRCLQFNVINPMSHQDAQSTCKLPLSPFDKSYRQKSPQALCTSKNVYKQLKCVGIQQLKNTSSRKQHILLNCHGDSAMNTIFKEDSNLEDSQCIVEDNTWEDSTMFKSVEKQYLPANKTHLKFFENDMKHATDIAEINLATDKHVIETSNNTFIKSGIKWTLQNIDAQSSKFVKEQIVALVDEETPFKKKKLTSKYAPNLETTTTICSKNEEGVQKKHYAAVKKDLIYANGRQNMIGK